MRKHLPNLEDCKALSDDEILSLLAKDYLQFILAFELNERVFSAAIGEHSLVQIQGDGVLVFEPTSTVLNSQKNIVISCGVHGNETAPIEICNELVKQLFEQKIVTKHRLMFIFANIPSMLVEKRFVEENLNRLFTPTLNSTSLEAKRAIRLMSLVSQFFAVEASENIHYDLHTAIRASKNEKFAVYPYLHGQDYCKKQLNFLFKCEVKTVLLSQSPTTTFSYYSSRYHKAHSFTIELGKVHKFNENNMQKFSAISRSLRELITQQSIALGNKVDKEQEIFTVNQVIIKQQEDFKLHFDDEIENFTGFKKDSVFASETGAIYKAEYDGEAIVFPNAGVEKGQRALLTVIPFDLD